jgi:hypothetical protein
MAEFLTGNKTASMADRGPDFYASPYAALPPLLCAEGRRLPRFIWEPSCGNGALGLPLRNRGFKVLASDLHDWGCPDAHPHMDFFSQRVSQIADLLPDDGKFGIVTNPPFGAVEEYIERAVGLAPYVALLLRLAFLESEGRMNWFPHVGLRRVHIIGERLPMMHRHGYVGPKLSSAGMCFAWFIFERDKRPARQVPCRWVSWKASAKRYPQTDADAPPAAKDQPTLFDEVAA